ncbi:MAG: pyridoxal-dependent decarboxylase [Pirellulaceae bacterium]
MPTPHDLIELAYDSQLFHKLAGDWAGVVAEHLSNVEASRGRVLNWYEPPDNIRLAEAILTRAPAAEDCVAPSWDQLQSRFGELLEIILSHGNNLHDPRYVGHQVPASIPIAALFDAIGSATNQVMAIYEMGPWATAVEEAILARIAATIGWRTDQFAGLLTHGGSLANATAILTARNVACPDSWTAGMAGQRSPVLVCQADAHYSVARAAGMLGIGTDNIVAVALDERRRMDPRSLATILRQLRADGRPIVAVCACACATPIGAFDPLNAIADVCEDFSVWLHVDAAHGAAAAFSDRYRSLVDGLQRADSIVWDAHKMMFVPALCTFVLYRQPGVQYRTFQQSAPYLFDPSAPGMAQYDSGLRTVECTKRAAAFGVWGIWSMFGDRLFAQLVEATFDRARQWYQMLAEADDFVPLHEPQANIVAFRYLPSALRDSSPDEVSRYQLALRRRMIQSGEFYLTSTVLDGVGALRTTIINPLTTEVELAALLDSLRRHGAV